MVIIFVYSANFNEEMEVYKIMMSDQIESFLDGLIQNTANRKLKWKTLNNLKCWEKFCLELRTTELKKYKEYSFSETDSFYIYKNGGYVLLLSACYSNAPVFSPALDKKFLIVKICSDMPFNNLCEYDSNEFKEKINILHKEICEKSVQKEMPDAMYAFFDSVINGD